MARPWATWLTDHERRDDEHWHGMFLPAGNTVGQPVLATMIMYLEWPEEPLDSAKCV